MGPREIILIVVCALVVVGVAVSYIVKKRKGKPTCDCGCSDCSACPHCAAAKEKQAKK